jgi:predicted DCC family thiol-disulfide oxidoreductase YuxK
LKEVPVSAGRLVFDGRCGFCTRSIGWLRRLDRHQRVAAVPLQAPGAPESVGATETECLASLRWRGDDGVRLCGAAAANAALGTALGSRLPMRLYRRTSRLQERGYAWVAANRYRLPGARPHCDKAPADCGQQ